MRRRAQAAVREPAKGGVQGHVSHLAAAAPRRPVISSYPHYNCPVYRTAERKGLLATMGHSTNFLMVIRLPSDQPEWQWTLRGVCMLCSLSL